MAARDRFHIRCRPRRLATATTHWPLAATALAADGRRFRYVARSRYPPARCTAQLVRAVPRRGLRAHGGRSVRHGMRGSHRTRPPRRRLSRKFRDGHAICRETIGTRAVVGWAWDNGIPFISTGVVYDPEGFLTDPARKNPRDRCAIRGCDPSTAPGTTAASTKCEKLLREAEHKIETLGWHDRAEVVVLGHRPSRLPI